MDRWTAHPTNTDPLKLSPRERHVIDLMLTGLSCIAISRESGLAHGSVRNYAHRAFKKLGVHSHVELVTKYAKDDFLTIAHTYVARPGVFVSQHVLTDPLGLTKTERRIADLVMSGHKGWKDVALVLGVTRENVQRHASHMFRKLGLRKKRELIAKLREAGPVSAPSSLDIDEPFSGEAAAE